MIRAKKHFGQHFLEPAWVTKVIRVVNPGTSDLFIEIGPGRGELTGALAAAAARVAAFEIDSDLARVLLQSADTGSGPPPNLTVVEGDFLEATAVRIAEALDGPGAEGAPAVRVAGNLPYNVAAPILFKLIELYRGGLPFQDATVMVQREVAERLCAAPGTRDYGVLTILAGRHASVERLLDLPPGAFRPMPAVYSTVVRLRFHPAAPPARSEPTLEALVRAVFTRRRKTLSNALLAFPAASRLPPADALAAAGIDARRRPETLTAEEVARLADVYTSITGSG